MNTELQQFQFNTHQLNVIIDDAGEPWFIAKQVAEILEYSDAHKMTSKLDDDEKSNRQIGGLGPDTGGRGIICINESGLYSAILTSQKPAAKSFKRWVTHEVLPSIRKTGGYAVAVGHSKQMLELKDQLIDSLKAQLDQTANHLQLAQTIASKAQDAEKGAWRLYYDEEAKVQRLQRARGKVSMRERQDILEKHREGLDVPAIARWSYRSRDMVKRILAEAGVRV